MKQIMRKQESGVPIVYLLIYLLFAYILTIGILLLLALLLYKLKLSESIISGGITLTYVIASFLGGFMAGKKMKHKRYLWGLLMGVAYYVILMVLSLVVNHATMDVSSTMLTTFVLCCGGGMLGGMLS